MQAACPAVYCDQYGEDQTVIENDGKALRMVVRGVEFISMPFGSFDSLTAQNPEQALQASFRLDPYNDLLAGTIVFDAPLTVLVGNNLVPGCLKVHIDLEGAGTNAAERHWADPRMALSVSDKRYASSGGWGSFEAELLQIQRQLPSDVHLKCCFGCAFSGYNPYGDGIWGMFCHRNHKGEYLSAKTKAEWFHLTALSAEYVQEIFLCPEFEPWNEKSGYRDPLHLPVMNQS